MRGIHRWPGPIPTSGLRLPQDRAQQLRQDVVRIRILQAEIWKGSGRVAVAVLGDHVAKHRGKAIDARSGKVNPSLGIGNGRGAAEAILQGSTSRAGGLPSMRLAPHSTRSDVSVVHPSLPSQGPVCEHFWGRALRHEHHGGALAASSGQLSRILMFLRSCGAYS